MDVKEIERSFEGPEVLGFSDDESTPEILIGLD
jgi:hypothetical protein